MSATHLYSCAEAGQNSSWYLHQESAGSRYVMQTMVRMEDGRPVHRDERRLTLREAFEIAPVEVVMELRKMLGA